MEFLDRPLPAKQASCTQTALFCVSASVSECGHSEYGANILGLRDQRFFRKNQQKPTRSGTTFE